MAGRDRPKSGDQFKQGLGLLWSAARQAAGEIREELDKTNIGKAVDDAGRELGRAFGNVAKHLGAELKKVQPPEPDWAHRADDGHEPWPGTREEYERRYGPVPGGQDWPRSAEEYERRHGHKPGAKPSGPTPDDPGFRIADDDDNKPR